MHALLLFLVAVGPLCAALPQQETSVSRGSPHPRGCLLPDTPLNGEYTSPSCKPGKQKAGCNNVPGTPVPEGWAIKYRCFKGYSVSSESSRFSVCDSGVWDNPIGCVKMCSRLRSSTVDIVCRYKDLEVDCKQVMKPNTTAEIKCKPNYSVSKPLEYSTILCEGSMGLWSHPLPECVADCGTPNKYIESLNANGQSTARRDFPWLAAIYVQINTLRWAYACSGTLISPYIVLAAAHCITKPEARILDQSQIRVGLGKYFWDYYKEENNSVIAQVKKITIPRGYRGNASSYAFDIAIMDLSVSVPVNHYIMPACVDWSKTGVFKLDTAIEVGYVSGWGASPDDDDGLRTTTLKYVDKTECLQKVSNDFQKFIVDDKFCTAETDGKIENGYSGVGMTVVKQGVHFIVGVFSTRFDGDQPISLFTDLKEHLSWIATEKSVFEELHRSDLNKEVEEEIEEVTQVPKKMESDVN